MENITFLWDQLWQYIDPLAVIIVLLSGMIVKKYLVLAPGSTAFKTLFVATVFISVYVFILYLQGALLKENYLKYFVSFCVATSFYELLLKKLVKAVKAFKD